MPELTVIHIGLLALMLVAGVVIGWISPGGPLRKGKDGRQRQLAGPA